MGGKNSRVYTVRVIIQTMQGHKYLLKCVRDETIELVGIQCALGHVTGIVHLKNILSL